VARGGAAARSGRRTQLVGAAVSFARREPLLLGLIAVGAALRFVTLAQQSLYLDEAATVRLLREPAIDMFRGIATEESTPPLYYALARAWSSAFGTGEVGLRSFSALVGTATIPVAYAAARQFVSRRAALAAAGLVATSPFLVWYSQEARAYALLVLFGAASLYFLGVALNETSRTAVRWWAVVSILALATHYFGIFLAAGESP
jgi:mannosyltransferase